MPSNKKTAQILLSDKYREKLIVLGKKEEKSISAIGGKIIENYIDNYEAIHGEIKIEKETHSD